MAGAELSTGVVLILGAANLVADGFSMAAANFSGTRAEREQFLHLKAIEEQQVDEEPEGEREELRQIFHRKGFRGDDLERMVTVISSDRDQWVRTMLTEEYGLPLEVRSPLQAALSTMVSFVLAGAVPLVPFVMGVERAFLVSCVLVGLVFFAIGSARQRWSLRAWWLLGAETLAIGGAAAGLAYGAGALLRNWVAV